MHLKVRFADFRTITRSHTLAEPSNATSELWQAAAGMLQSRLPAGHLPVRLLGMGTSGFERSGQVQQTLFDEEERRRQSRLDAVTDEIAARYGKSSIGRAGGIRKQDKSP